jgi:hypothetical protein
MNPALTNPQRPQVVHTTAEFGSNSVRDHKVLRPQQNAPHSRSVYVRQGKTTLTPVSALTDVAPATADYRQAEYFVRLLNQSRQRIEQRIDNYQRAIARSGAGGETENVRGLRRMVRIDEQDRRAVGKLIENLQRRFPVRPVR